MIYHYMGAEVQIVKVKPNNIVTITTLEGKHKSDHHIAELKADGGVQEISEAIEKLNQRVPK